MSCLLCLHNHQGGRTKYLFLPPYKGPVCSEKETDNEISLKCFPVKNVSPMSAVSFAWWIEI